MVICPIANSVGCEKCAVVKFCLLKTVLGNYGEEPPGQDFEEPTIKVNPDSDSPDS